MKTRSTIIDTTLGGAGVSSPWWMRSDWWVQFWDNAEPIIQGLVLVGGLILIILRIMVAWRDYKQKRD